MSKDFKPPKHWTTWMTSDIHFGHANCIDYCSRPFANVDEFKEQFITNFNKLVRPQDLTIFVGDVFFYHTKDQMKETLARMNGRKILVKGNHDFEHRIMMNAGFELSVDEMVMTIAGERVVFSHYPFRMSKWIFKWVKIKAKFSHWMRWLGIPTKPIFFEKYHERRPHDQGQFLIHGHTHSKHKINGKAIHVGVDAWNYKPVNIQEISNIITNVKKNGLVYTKYNSNED
jgi:calcineurin-like phosphoesterase family protein